MIYTQLYSNLYMIMCTFIYSFTLYDNVMIYKDIEATEIYDYSQIYIFNQENFFLCAKQFYSTIFIVIL